MSLCRGRFGLSLGFLFKRLQSGEQGMDTSRFQSSCSLPALAPCERFFCKADGQVERGESLLPPLSFSVPRQWGPPCLCAPPIPPPSDPPAVQQQCDREGRGPSGSGGVSRPDLPGVAVAYPPAGCTSLHLGRAAAALSIQLGWAREVRHLKKHNSGELQPQ